jgi:hypothetical protein
MAALQDVNPVEAQEATLCVQQEPLDNPVALLPAPAIHSVLQNLSAKDLMACCLVSKEWRSYATVGRRIECQDYTLFGLILDPMVLIIVYSSV